LKNLGLIGLERRDMRSHSHALTHAWFTLKRWVWLQGVRWSHVKVFPPVQAWFCGI